MIRRIIPMLATLFILSGIVLIPQGGPVGPALATTEVQAGWNLLIDPETGEPHCHEDGADCHT